MIKHFFFFINLCDFFLQTDRQGSIIVVFTLVFSSEYLPTDSAVRKVFTDNAAPTQSGTLEVTVGIYVLTESSIVVGEVKVIENDKNPTPSKSTGKRVQGLSFSPSLPLSPCLPPFFSLLSPLFSFYLPSFSLLAPPFSSLPPLSLNLSPPSLPLQESGYRGCFSPLLLPLSPSLLLPYPSPFLPPSPPASPYYNRQHLIFHSHLCKYLYLLLCGPRQTNLVLIAYASSEGSGENIARTSAARSYKQ